MIGVAMNPALYIRQQVFGCQTQDAFAQLLGASQAAISRWEKDGRVPGRWQDLVRRKANELRLEWDDRWFFSVPSAARRAAS